MTILQGSIYTDAGATAADNVDGDITSKIQVTGSVNTNIVGTYILTYDVKDNAGNSAISKTRIVYVISSNPQNNHAPIITSLPVKSVDEKQEYDYQIVASDSDGDSLTYSLVSAPSWLHINSATGFIYGIAPSVNSDAHYDVTVQVSDGTDSDTQSYTITVMDTSAVGNGNTRYLNDDFYNQNRYFDQFNTGKITVYNPAEKSNQAVVSLVIVCMTIGIALLIVLTAFILVLFYQENLRNSRCGNHQSSNCILMKDIIKMENKAYREISFDYTNRKGISVNFKISANSSFLELYNVNPSRIQNILSAHFCSALGEIFLGEELDFFMQDINIRAEEEKMSLIRKIQSGENSRN